MAAILRGRLEGLRGAPEGLTVDDRDQHPHTDAAIDDELEFHFAETVESLVRHGWTEEAARREAERRFGDLARYRRHLARIDRRQRSHWGDRLESIARDARYGLRTLLRAPGFTLVAVLALALGIGVNTAVFSVVDRVLLRPLPFADPDRLVIVTNYTSRGGASLADFLDWKAQTQSFESLDVFEINRFTNSRFTLTGDGDPEQVVGYRVTSTFFETLGVNPAVGRTFLAGEDLPAQLREARAGSVVLSDRLWRRRYGSRLDVLGSTVTLNGRPHVIVGVMPPGFEFWERDVEAWAILPLDPPTRRGPFFMRGVARLKPGVTIARAAAEMDVIARDTERTYPRDYSRLRIPVTPLREIVVGDIRPLLWVLSGAVVLVLLIAISNVANLTLGRATGRQREMAIRLSVGAGRGRIIRQLMVESLVLALIGGALGTLFAIGGVAALRSLGPPGLPRLDEMGVDARVLAFTLGTSIASAMLFGLVPALAASGIALTPSLKDGSRSGESRRHGRARAGLVVAQVTLSVILLIGAGLLIRSFTLLERVDPGFRTAPDHIPRDVHLADGRAVRQAWRDRRVLGTTAPANPRSRGDRSRQSVQCDAARPSRLSRRLRDCRKAEAARISATSFGPRAVRHSGIFHGPGRALTAGAMVRRARYTTVSTCHGHQRRDGPPALRRREPIGHRLMSRQDAARNHRCRRRREVSRTPARRRAGVLSARIAVPVLGHVVARAYTGARGRASLRSCVRRFGPSIQACPWIESAR